jgi:hypothetical protein
MSKEAFAIIGVRLVGVLFAVLGGILLVSNLIETGWDFNPNYWLHYLLSQLLRPIMLGGAGIGLLLGSKELGKRLARCD